MATKSLEILIDEFNRLPGIGRKSATRLAFYVLEMSEAEIERFSKALKDAKENVKKCRICGNFSEEDVCEICSDLFRKTRLIPLRIDLDYMFQGMVAGKDTGYFIVSH